jgi:DNA-binding NtrC family response regulator
MAMGPCLGREKVQPAEQQALQTNAPPRVCLIVEDEPTIRAYLKAILQRKNVHVLEASTALQALQKVHKTAGGIDLIITDIQMPGDMDGVDLAHLVRNSHPAVPVILISGGDGSKGAAASFPFVQKPILPETILQMIEDLLIPVKTLSAML